MHQSSGSRRKRQFFSTLSGKENGTLARSLSSYMIKKHLIFLA
ncbi:hypothetical protein TPCCA_0162a [Treponema paraluiscuniculi Cuniculi A]|uniref:Uncharacterized protein n=2 Tax=Treponema paraluiscuniculi TaxID=53435 RepID=F7XRB6_TREPU|nr:hypothetical protein TPCCA_0162a [Treponema paraluiscuniculi Cuniculi A]WKC72051.1 hypothetical protein TPLL2_0162a [Treponema paraluiscuniculi]